MAAKLPPNPRTATGRKGSGSDAPMTLPLGSKSVVENTKPEIDPSRFGAYEFEPGLREELILAEKPHIDPKLLQDTVPPNRQPVLTSPDPLVSTPRGGFVAPKVTEPAERPAKALDVLPSRMAVVKTDEAPSAPPVDTSRTQETLQVPAIRRKRDHTKIVVGVVLFAFVVIGIAAARKAYESPQDNELTAPAARDLQPPRASSTPVVAPAAPPGDEPSTQRDIAPQGSPKAAPDVETPSQPTASKKSHVGPATSAVVAPSGGIANASATVEDAPKPHSPTTAAPASSARRKFHFSSP